MQSACAVPSCQRIHALMLRAKSEATFGLGLTNLLVPVWQTLLDDTYAAAGSFFLLPPLLCVWFVATSEMTLAAAVHARAIRTHAWQFPRTLPR